MSGMGTTMRASAAVAGADSSHECGPAGDGGRAADCSDVATAGGGGTTHGAAGDGYSRGGKEAKCGARFGRGGPGDRRTGRLVRVAETGTRQRRGADSSGTGGRTSKRGDTPCCGTCTSAGSAGLRTAGGERGRPAKPAGGGNCCQSASRAYCACRDCRGASGQVHRSSTERTRDGGFRSNDAQSR